MTSAALPKGSPSEVTAPSAPQAAVESSLFAVCMEYLHKVSPFELSSLLILLTAVLTGPGEWYISAPVCCAALAALVVSPLRTSKPLWLSLATLVATYDVLHWYEADNHKYLLAYSMLAVWVTLHLRDRVAALSYASRLLIASTFCCALSWKLLARDFANGEFFVWSMLFDDRFEPIAQHLAGVAPSMHEANRKALAQLTSWQGLDGAQALRTTPDLVRWAKVMVAWTFVIEGLIAAAYLVPSRFSLARWASPLLLLFVATTYALAPVLGFGYLLLALGIASETRPRMRLAYLALFLGLRLHTVPWTELAQRAVGSFT
jgi:hypothetical protein